MKNTLFLLAVSSLALSACGLVEVEYDKLPKDSAAEIIEDVPVRETKNVTYTGVVAPAGISVYNQGTHRLVLPGGKFILLEANDIDLNGYVDEEVQIFGSLRPTVEAGGMIMRVERIELIEKEEELPVNPDDTDDVPFEEQSSDADLEPVELPANEEVIEEIEESEVIEEAEKSEVIEEAEEVSSVPSAEFKALIEVMSRQDYAAANWTQQYCTSHISFCAPVHRNWWFKSFGATSSTLWHVELSPEPIESLGQGPLVIELIAGSNTDADGTIDVSNGKAVGYKEWTFGRHFRISGDESLKDAILYITQNITDYAS
ncbi:MAG: hypothetical protein O3A80_02185 [bacterium]|nr:hypothetical protein [bacterium]